MDQTKISDPTPTQGITDGLKVDVPLFEVL